MNLPTTSGPEYYLRFEEKTEEREERENRYTEYKTRITGIFQTNPKGWDIMSANVLDRTEVINPGSPAFLVWATYSDGDTYHNISGRFSLVGIYADPEEAKRQRDLIINVETARDRLSYPMSIGPI